MFKNLFIYFFGVLLLLLSGCVSNTKHVAPVVDLDAAYAKQQGYYTVSAGETLYLISWRLDMNYQDLADINHISPPYKLKVGEKIYLASQKSVVLSKSGPNFGMTSPRQPDNHAEAQRKRVTAKHPASLKVTQDKSSLPKATERKKTTYDKTTVSKPIKLTAVKRPPSQSYSVTSWIWPAKGTVVGRYSESNKGINIAGKEGENVVACAPGEVVYAGHGLRAYGNLVIIKHNDTYLSAYAHNENLTVKEGDYVKQGQVIAYLGHTGTTKPMLHFEIRKNGKPVDPLKYLP